MRFMGGGLFQMTVDILMRPTTLRNWEILRETKKCLVIAKTFPKRYGLKEVGATHIPKKNILKIIKKTKGGLN